MSIAVLSMFTTSSTASSGSATASGSNTTEAASGFAALLTGQLSQASTGQGMALLQESTGMSALDTLDKDEAVSAETALIPEGDPSWLAMLGLPLNLPTTIAKASVQPEVAVETGGLTGQIGLSTNKQGGPDTTLSGLFSSLASASDNAATFTNNSMPAGEAANFAVDSFANTLAQTAQGTTAAPQTTATNTPLPNLEVRTPLHSPDWSKGFSEQVVWLARGDQQSAQLNINPPQLGPVQIALQLNGDQASAIFASPHAEVRQAIESSLPQLREMLSAAGINLGQADIGANLAQQQQQQQNAQSAFQFAQGGRQGGDTALGPDSVTVTEAASSTITLQRGRGMVDLFA